MLSYKDAGVDISAGDELVERLRKICPEIGGFGGLYPIGDSYLVAGTDGVGTKLKVAFAENRHDTVGIDLVAMSVNDVITTGAKPLFFLDYFATSKLNVDQAEIVLSGIVKGCRESGCILLGGETAEMPGFYGEGEYDLAGFCVGLVEKKRLIDGSTIVEEDVIVGIPSSGLHSNGFSLVRKVVSLVGQPDFDLLVPTRIYADLLSNFHKHYSIKGISHITGGGLVENVPRILPKGLGAIISKASWEVSGVFDWVQTQGCIAEEEMYRTFNMGIGMVVVLDPEEAKLLVAQYPECLIIGKILKGEGVSLL